MFIRLDKENETVRLTKRGKWLLLVIVLFILGFPIALMSFEIVPAGHRGVWITMGNVQEDETAGEGFHLKLPWVKLAEVNVRKEIAEEKTEAASSDLQSVYTTIKVEYKPTADQVWKLYQEYGVNNESWETKIIRPAIKEATKAAMARFTAEDLIKKRQEAKEAIKMLLVGRMADADIVIREVNITDFGFSKVFNDAIEAKVEAEQKAQQATNELERVKIDAQQRIAKAEADKSARQLNADARAYEIEAEAKATAEAYKVISASINDKVLRDKFLDKWNGILPKVMGGETGMLLQFDVDKGE